ncbi:hypothetical protein [Agromyces sp. SYSU T00194]|uniref:hypothetical protein n=1 Tax=Agromyces chitinivorans TaxID=3158560 RepID=UPI003394B0DD
MSELEPDQPTGITRRTVAKSMAWAVPAVAVATAVPAHAGASTDFVSFTGNACKEPGGGTTKFYYFEFKITNNEPTAKVVAALSLEVNGVVGTVFTPNIANVDPYTECIVTILSGEFPDSGNGTAYLTYSVNGVTQPVINSISAIDPDDLNNLPPIDNAQQCNTTYPQYECYELN